MFMKKPKPKNFDYRPRYYNPDKDPEEIRKRKLGFKRSRKLGKRRSNLLLYFGILVVVLYFYLRFAQII